MKHTPGPWTMIQGQDGDATRWGVYTDYADTKFRHCQIATVENGALGDTLETEGYNAALIAASPDLLEALECLLCEPMAERAVDKAKKAISKARKVPQ